ncbi:hypothetical protein KP509_34G011600 [Ceratopteris richardii]|nr:hypothetical protein KP509_34G011600 [Ceratopteris richardii]
MRASQEQHIGDSRFSTALSLSREDWAAIKIQTAFRAYLARKAFRALRGLVRLQAIFRGHIVRRKASRTFQCMQALLRVQTRIREMRMKAYENGGGVARSNLLQQHKQESSNEQKENLGDRNSLGYNSTVQSAEELQSTRTKKTDLTRLKREKLWAYALSRQPRDCPAKESSDFHAEHYSDKFHSGWTWLKHWMSATSWQDARLDSRLAELIVKDSKLDRPTAESRIEGDGVKKSDTLEGKFGETFDKSIVICPLQRQSLAMSNCRRVKTSSNSESRNTPSTRSLYRKCHTSPKNGRTRHHSLLDDEASLRSPDTPNYMSTTQSAFSKRSSRSLSLPKQKPFTSGREFNALSSARRRLSFSTTKGSLGSSKHTSKLP